MQTKLSEANRKSAGSIKAIIKLKHNIKKDADINGTQNITEVSEYR